MSEQYQKPENFLDRSGIGIADAVETIMREPEAPLDDAEKAEVLTFARDIMSGTWGDIQLEGTPRLEAVYAIPVARYQKTFFPDYFIGTEAGQRTLQDLGFAGQWLREEVNGFFVTSPALRAKTALGQAEIANASNAYAKALVAEHLIVDPEGTTDHIFREWDSVTVDFKPEEVINKFKGLMAYRGFFREVAHHLPRETDGVLGAQRLMLDMTRGRVNELIADLYPNLLNLRDQLKYLPEDEAAPLRQKIDELGPAVERIFYVEDERRLDDFYRRLDVLANGTYLTKDDNGTLKYQPISHDLVSMLDAQDAAEFAGHPGLSPEGVQAIERARWSASEVQQFTEGILREWDLLSANHATWDEVQGRDGAAEDGLWQVVIKVAGDIKGESFNVNTKKQIITVPENYDRTMLQGSPAGGLLVVSHELTHVLQGLVDKQLAGSIPLAQIKGRRYLTLREAGGLYQEQIVLEEYMGRHRPINPHYYRALAAKLQGANRMQATRAFYESYITAEAIDMNDPAANAAAANLAVDRTLRLYRNGGFNTQPLDYAEQGLIVRELRRVDPEKAGRFIMSSGTFDVRDAAALHRYGLLPSVEVPHQPAHEVMRAYVRAHPEFV